MKKWTMMTAMLLSFAHAVSADAESAEQAAPAASIFAIPGAYLLLLTIVALIAAFALVARMKAKLKTADRQTHASRYIRDGSFDLRIESDRFLYEKVQRRKIENKASSQQSQKG